jgi:hypothetical protein
VIIAIMSEMARWVVCVTITMSELACLGVHVIRGIGETGFQLCRKHCSLATFDHCLV